METTTNACLMKVVLLIFIYNTVWFKKMDSVEQYTAPQHTPDSWLRYSQVLYSLYGLTCVGYAQNSLEFVSRSPPIHSVGRQLLPLHRQSICSNWWFQRQMLFLVGGSNVETKTKRTLHGSWRLSFNEFTNAKNVVLHSSHFALNWRCCTGVC